MQQYKELIQDILDNGIDSDDRTGIGTKSLFGRQIRFDLSKGFPLVTLKKTYWKGIVIELLWLLHGDANIAFLKKHGVNIWDEWADENGDLGPIYGQQWRSWRDEDQDKLEFIDQIKNVIHRIKDNPNDRRLIVSAWNVAEIPVMKLPPCHCFFQFYVRNGKLSCQLYQRSADIFLGVPFNIASYALLTHLIAHACKLEVGEFVHTFGDVHLYNNHLNQAKEMLKRDPKGLAKLVVKISHGAVMDYIDHTVPRLTWSDIQLNIQLSEYNPHPTIKADVAI